MDIKKRYRLIFASVGIVSLILLLLFLAYRFIAPFGTVVKYQFSALKDADKMSKINGAQTGADINTTDTRDSLLIPSQVVRQEIVSFNLQLITQEIEGVWVNLRFKGNPREIKMGVRGNTNDKYFYKPLYQRDLESAKVERVSEELGFWQKERNYSNFAEFIAEPPIDKIITSYFFDPSDVVEMQTKSMKTGQGRFSQDVILRGSHTFYVQVMKSPFEFSVVKQDSNTYDGDDSVKITIENNGKQMAEQTIPDDGIVDKGGLQMQPQKTTLKVDEAKPGIYKVILQDQSKGGDVRITHLESNQSNIVLAPPIFILGEKATSLWTNSKEMTATTVHSVGIQTIRLDNEYELKVAEMNKKYTFDLNKEKKQEKHQLVIPKNDLIIAGDGYFALSEKSFFNPEPIKTIPLTDLESLNSADYGIVRYAPVQKDGEWYKTSLFFDPKDIKIEGDKLYFSLESPGLAKNGEEYSIDSLEVTVKKPGFFDKKFDKKFDIQPGEENQQKQGIIVRVKNTISEFFGRIRTKITSWIPKKVKIEPSPSPAPSQTTAPSPTPKLSPTPSSTPKPVEKISDLPIRILNGGAERGAAASLSATLREQGFGNVTTGNADNYNYEQVTLKYRLEDTGIADKLFDILKKEAYGSVTKSVIATTSAQIQIIIGKK